MLIRNNFIIIIILFVCLFFVPKMVLANEDNNYKKIEEYHYCLYDVYDKNHLTKMKEYIESHVYKDISLVTYYNHELLWKNIEKDTPLLNCDIINMSFMTTFSYFHPHNNLYKIKVNLFEYNEKDTIVVSSAGNYKKVERQNIFTETMNPNIYIIGQAELIDENTIIHHYAVGEEIDFVVPNYNEAKGTSAAAAYVSSLFINALEKGVPKNNLHDLLVFSGIYSVEDIDYRVLDIEKTEENIHLFINKEKLNKTEYHYYGNASYDKPMPYGFWLFLLSFMILSVFSITLIIYIKYRITLEIYLKKERNNNN